MVLLLLLLLPLLLLPPPYTAAAAADVQFWCFSSCWRTISVLLLPNHDRGCSTPACCCCGWHIMTTAAFNLLTLPLPASGTTAPCHASRTCMHQHGACLGV
jgi:hypothetical protein